MQIFCANAEGFKDIEGQPWIIQKAPGYKCKCERKQICPNEKVRGSLGDVLTGTIAGRQAAEGITL